MIKIRAMEQITVNWCNYCHYQQGETYCNKKIGLTANRVIVSVDNVLVVSVPLLCRAYLEVLILSL